MPTNRVLRLSKVISYVLVCAAGASVAWVNPGILTPQRFALMFIALAAGFLAATTVFSFGVLAACVAAGGQVTLFRLGSEWPSAMFRLRGVQVSLGVPIGGRVEWDGIWTARQLAAVTIGGPLADLVVGGVLLVLLEPRDPPLGYAFALALTLWGIQGFLPSRSRSGQFSAGARLLMLRAGHDPDENEATRAYALFSNGRAEELLELHAALEFPGTRVSSTRAAELAAIEWMVAFLPDLPDDAAELAERRIDWLRAQRRIGRHEYVATLPLAMLRLRQQRFAEAAQLSDAMLGTEKVPAAQRHMAPALAIVAHESLGTPTADEVAALAEENPYVDIAIAEIKWILDPEGPRHPLAAGRIAMMLRRAGRVAELLELHAEFPPPAGQRAVAHARVMHELEWNLVLVPGLPAEVLDVIDSRIQWVLANFLFGTKPDPRFHAAARHTLAVLRLRQGRFAEVEPLCAEGLAARFGADNRATILATVVLARRALGQRYDKQLAQAVALAPDADLVTEAASRGLD